MTCMNLAHYSIGSPDSIFTHCEVGSHAQSAAIADTLGVFRDSIDAMTAIGRKAAAASALNLYELKTDIYLKAFRAHEISPFCVAG